MTSRPTIYKIDMKSSLGDLAYYVLNSSTSEHFNPQEGKKIRCEEEVISLSPVRVSREVLDFEGVSPKHGLSGSEGAKVSFLSYLFNHGYIVAEDGLLAGSEVRHHLPIITETTRLKRLISDRQVLACLEEAGYEFVSDFISLSFDNLFSNIPISDEMKFDCWLAVASKLAKYGYDFYYQDGMARLVEPEFTIQFPEFTPEEVDKLGEEIHISPLIIAMLKTTLEMRGTNDFIRELLNLKKIKDNLVEDANTLRGELVKVAAEVTGLGEEELKLLKLKELIEKLRKCAAKEKVSDRQRKILALVRTLTPASISEDDQLPF